MRVFLLALLPILLLGQNVLAQKGLPTIKATSLQADIRDGKKFLKNAWRIVPQEKLDVYKTSSNRVTFYTDIDSITFTISPKIGERNFIIVVNGKDSARTQIKYEPSYLDKLKRAEMYSYSDNRFVPKFTYQPMSDPNLVKIRQVLQLDSIAGKGNEVSQILNLLHWAHNVVRHDGSSDNPSSQNAIDLINICKTEKRGVNCRMMATILNECYLSLGIKSRFVTCMPKETKFDDCHVINMVYSHELKKWIWIDPTFDAYVMNEKGELLGIQEVREKLINGKPLILNPDANWNRQNTQTKEDYLDNYMAKNLYRLEAPLVSRYNTETANAWNERAYVELLPLDGLVQVPQKNEHVNNSTGERHISYKTNNPNIFWANPE
jgi:Transglutaminase-like superfamily.